MAPLLENVGLPVTRTSPSLVRLPENEPEVPWNCSRPVELFVSVPLVIVKVPRTLSELLLVKPLAETKEAVAEIDWPADSKLSANDSVLVLPESSNEKGLVLPAGNENVPPESSGVPLIVPSNIQVQRPYS